MTEQSHDQRYAPPQAHVEDVPPAAGGMVLAGRGQRLGAVLIDLVVASGSWWAVSLFTGWNPMATGLAWDAAMGLNVLLGFALFALVHGATLAASGQTLGKKMVGIRITRTDGSPASLLRLLGLRYGVGYLLAVVPTIGPLYGLVDALMIFRASRRCLHDLIADTIVLKA